MNALRNERGAAFVLIGLALVLLASVIGFATDYGVLAYTRNQGQAAVDAAALAGASGLGPYVEEGDDSQIHERIAALDSANDVRGFAADLGSGGAAVDLMVYDQDANEFTCTSGCDPEEVNAVRVTKTGYDTPVYFSWARNLLGADTPASHTINVSATAYLGCPPEQPIGNLGPIALRECEISYPDDCSVPDVLQGQGDNSAFTSFNLNGSNVCKALVEGAPPDALQDTVAVGDPINLIGTGQAASCLMALKTRFDHCSEASCASDPPDPTCTLTLPVIDCGGPESNAIVTGFAEACVTEVEATGNPKYVRGPIICGESTTGGTGGECFGLFGNRPILIR